jgi:hypothetical protein
MRIGKGERPSSGGTLNKVDHTWQHFQSNDRSKEYKTRLP